MILTLVIAMLSVSKVDMAEVRYLFTVAEHNEESCKKLFEVTEGYTMDFDPIAYAYHAAAEMTMANHSVWPATKLTYFNKGRTKLEKVIIKYQDNIELRYIRFAVQYNTPAFLGYRNNLDSDRNYVMTHLETADIPKAHKSLMKATVSQK